MLAALGPYGQERQCSWGDERVALGANLSDPSTEHASACADAQPIWTPDRSACLVADITLHNRADLARQLNLPSSSSNISLLMAAWLRWGPACLDHLLGAFSFAVWTPARQELFAARDHSGIRPLFYHRSDRFFALASMPQGLLALPGMPRGFNESSVLKWLASLHPDRSTTFFAGVQRLPPGHFLRIAPDAFEVRQYWHPANTKPTRYRRNQDYADALVELLDTATADRLPQAGPVGSFLSAGLDSASVTASAARLLAAQGRGLTAFTSVPRPEFNRLVPPGFLPSEAESAAAVAHLYPNVEHVLADSRGFNPLPILRTWTDALDGPASNVSNLLWFSAIFQQAKQRGIGVILAGDFGNCTISWSNWSILAHLFRRVQWLKLALTVHALRRHSYVTYKAAFRFSTHGLLPKALVRPLLAKQNLDSLYTPLLNPDWMKRLSIQEQVFDSIYSASPDPMLEHSALFEDCDMGAANAAVTAVTGIEIRDPTQDKRILEFCFSIPFEQFLAEGLPRSLARRALKGRVPDSVRLEPARGLQSADWYLPFRESLPALRAELALIEQSPAARQLLDLPRIRTLLDTFPESGYERPAVRMLWHGALIYAIAMGYFLRTHDPEIVPEPSAPSLA